MKVIKQVSSCKDCPHLLIDKSYETNISKSVESAICNNGGGILKYDFDYRTDRLDIPHWCPCLNKGFDDKDMLNFIDFYKNNPSQYQNLSTQELLEIFIKENNL